MFLSYKLYFLKLFYFSVISIQKVPFVLNGMTWYIPTERYLDRLLVSLFLIVVSTTSG